MLLKRTGGEKVTSTSTHKESFYQAKIIKWLKDTYPGAFVWSIRRGGNHSGKAPSGVDLLDGLFLQLGQLPDSGPLDLESEKATKTGRLQAADG